MAEIRHRAPDQLADLLRRATARLGRLRDPRTINPAYVFAAGLSVVVPIWLLFLNH